MLQKMFGVLEAMQLFLPKTILGQCDASQRPDDRVSHALISMISAHCLVQHCFHLSNHSQIFIGILVFQLANVTDIPQENISHILMSFLASLSLVLEEKEVPYCFVLSWKDLGGAGGTRRPTSVALIQSSKELYEDSR